MLDGVTGSGKTEVYFEAIAEALRQRRQAARPASGNRADRAIPDPVHRPLRLRAGGLAQRPSLVERRRAWRAIASGEAKVVVGARSSLFLPYPNLGLIVVDEAHEPSFKQEEGVQYHARDVAVMRGHFEEIPVDPRLGHAGDRDPPHGRDRPLSRAAADRAPWRRRNAGDPRHRHDAGPAAARALACADAGRRASGQPGCGRPIAAVPQSPRLCPADLVPPLRPPLPMPQLHRLDGRAPADAPARLPPLRPCHAAAQGLSRMRRGRQPGRLRPRRRTDRRRDRRTLPRRPRRRRHVRHHLVAGPRRRIRPRRWRKARSTSSSARNW